MPGSLTSIENRQDNEPSWGIAHRICAPRLSRDAVSQWCGEMVDLTDELVAKWRGHGESDVGDGVSLIDELNRLNLEATTLTLFGKKLGCIAAAAPHPMLAGMEDATSEAMKRPTRPGFVNWMFFGRKFRDATRVMREEYAEDLVRHRRAGGGGDGDGLGDRKDLLSALLGATDPETGLGLTESQVVDEIVSMPIGSSTAPCVLATAVYFLLRNPECVAEARRELDEVLGPWSGSNSASDRAETEREGREERKKTKKLGAEHLPRLRYIEGIVRESLRLSFAAPGFNIEPIPRTTATGTADTQPVHLAGGRYQVAHDQAMIVVLAGANRDPAVFADPLAFRPERMVGAAFEALPPGVRKWFGNGRRACIGRHWAWQFCVVVVAGLLREVDFEAVDEGYELAQDGWFNLRPVGFRVRARPRRA